MINVYGIALGVCAIAALAVFGTMIYSIIAFRKPREMVSSERNKFIEVIWALVPIAIVCFAALPSLQSIDAPTHSVTIIAQS